MNKEEILKNLELYSNAIVGFIVIQSLAFCYYIGTNEYFRNLFKNRSFTAIFLLIIFAVAYILAFYAIYYLAKKINDFGGDYKNIVNATYKGKAVVIFIFCIIHMSAIISVMWGK